MRSLPTPRRTAYRLLVYCLMVLGSAASVGLAQDQVEPAQGELKIEGTHITRLVLRSNDGHTQEWSNLSGSITLPVGGYRVLQFELNGSYACQPQSFAGLGAITVTQDKPAVLKAGGPLRQIVKVNPQGRTLVMSYGLLGIGDEKHAPPTTADRRATFTVYKGEAAIATGTFEYG